MSALDHVVPATTNRDSPKGHNLRGETISIYDFYGRIIETVGITSKGDFDTKYGLIPRDEFGTYVLKVTGHPGAPR